MHYPATFNDQMGREIVLENRPKKIISLVPSQTELLFYLGLQEEVVGITKFCVHPTEMFHGKTRIGGTKQINFEKIVQLQPDLIIGNKEENDQEQVQQLMKYYPVWMSDIITVDDALSMIEHVGKLVDKEQQAIKLLNDIAYEQQIFSTIAQINNGKRTAYFIWKDPYMTAGAGTFINNMLEYCGLNNVFGQSDRYPEVTQQEIMAAQPELILLSSEPYPFKEKHIEEFKNLCPQAEVLAIDGEMFSWYGNRMLYAPKYFLEMFKK